MNQNERNAEIAFDPVTTRVSSVAVERVSWLWPGRIPLGKLTVLDGDPGLGKSTVTLDLASRVTTGAPMPGEDEGRPPAAVVLLSAEDGIGDTIRPRLEEAGADVHRVFVFEGITNTPDLVHPATLPADIGHLGDVIEANAAELVVIDPFSAFLSTKVDSYRDGDVRTAMAPLAKMAEQKGVAILVVRHLSKSGGPNAVYRGGGSIGIIGAARAGLLVARDPEDEARCILAVSKLNLAAKPPALAYRLVPGDLHDCARVKWEGATAHLADDLLALPSEDRTARDEATEFLLELLGDEPVDAKVVRRMAEDAGLSWSTVKRAKDRAGVNVKRHGFGKDGKWVWSLAYEDHDPSIGTIEDRPQNVDPFDPYGDPVDLFEGEP